MKFNFKKTINKLFNVWLILHAKIKKSINMQEVCIITNGDIPIYIITQTISVITYFIKRLKDILSY